MARVTLSVRGICWFVLFSFARLCGYLFIHFVSLRQYMEFCKFFTKYNQCKMVHDNIFFFHFHEEWKFKSEEGKRLRTNISMKSTDNKKCASRIEWVDHSIHFVVYISLRIFFGLTKKRKKESHQRNSVFSSFPSEIRFTSTAGDGHLQRLYMALFFVCFHRHFATINIITTDTSDTSIWWIKRRHRRYFVCLRATFCKW